MPLSWNEVKKRALEFSKEWDNVVSEKAEAKTFWDEFFSIFGISRKRVASFEEPVKKLGDKQGFIDLFWKGVLIVEHKSKGKNLDRAFTQALDYFPGISEEELPKYVLVSDFNRFRLYNLEDNTDRSFLLNELHSNIHLFDFILGFKKQTYKDEDPVNIIAANLMGNLHDALKNNRYEGHKLEVFLVRILFCLFADDTGIFPRGHFEYYLKKKTKIDGSDLGSQIAHIFQILNTHEDNRQSNLDEDINAFPYVNGDLYKENLEIPSFDSDMRSIILECCSFDWSKISPAIFGSLFQSVMDKQKRRDLGAHYTSEKNILKVINGLFLDELYEEFYKSKSSENRLQQFHNKISSLKFLDPACGCGNFLIIAYRELRLLEIEVLKELYRVKAKDNLKDETAEPKSKYAVQMRLEAKEISKIDVDCMYGIEIEEFPSRIAEVAMWLIDHQMNTKLSVEFGDYFARIPLKKSPHIHNRNALQLDWNEVIPKSQCNYILGNPPFIGKQLQSNEQKTEMETILHGIKGNGLMDYVTAWYVLAAKYIQNTNIKVAFVSTNSITQGEQVGILWNELITKYSVSINFAHRTFKWYNEAKGRANVFVVIIGFSIITDKTKRLFDYENPKAEAVEIDTKNINPYLFDGDNTLILSKSKPICNVPEIFKGNQPTEGGFLLLDDEEKSSLINSNPDLIKFIRPLVSGREFINGLNRWCFWLIDFEPNELRKYPEIIERLQKVKEFREKSTFADTRELAAYPYRFRDIKNPDNFIVIPATTSESRKYIPFGYFNKDYIPSNSVYIIPDASIYLFGVLSSDMHMSWVKYVCGRLKSDYRYSKDIVYNNYPWPENPSEKNIKQVEEFAQLVLDVRKEYPNSSLADLYDPLAMPKKLVDAHNKLDKAVDLCYRPQPFPNELSRLEFLFDLYKKYTEPLLKESKKRGRK